MKLKKWVCVLLAVFLLAGLFCMPALAAAEAGYEAAPRGSIVKAICGSNSKPSLA